MSVDSDSWKLVLPCRKAEAERLADDIELLLDVDPLPVLMTREPDPDNPDDWLLEAYFEEEPDSAAIAAVQALVPSSAGIEPRVERVPADDWVTLSQSGLEPVVAGRFYVHTPAHRDSVPEGAIAFEIDAGQAFGTGQHETTTGCLLMLDGMKAGGRRFANVIDVGTGTGLLAFAALRLWPTAEVMASDIDPVATTVATENAEINDIPVGTGPGQVELVTATGLAHPRIRRRQPFDLIIANILAGPLIDMAPELTAALEPGGEIVLAGLLDSQADDVASAYRRQGMRLAERIDRGDWPSLRLVKRRRSGD